MHYTHASHLAVPTTHCTLRTTHHTPHRQHVTLHVMQRLSAPMRMGLKMDRPWGQPTTRALTGCKALAIINPLKGAPGKQ